MKDFFNILWFVIPRSPFMGRGSAMYRSLDAGVFAFSFDDGIGGGYGGGSFRVSLLWHLGFKIN